jgi:hypothetical protein
MSINFLNTQTISFDEKSLFINMTRGGIPTEDVPPDAVFCPPGGFQFYEANDPAGQECLLQFSGKRNKKPVPRYIITPDSIPSNSKVATQVKEMFVITPSLGSLWSYNVDRKNSLYTKTHSIENLTINADLRVLIEVPQAVDVSINSSGVIRNENIADFTISPLQTIEFTVSMNLSGVEKLSKYQPPTRNWKQQLVVEIRPTNYVGPIFIKDLTRRPSEPDVPPPTTPPTNNPNNGGFSGGGGGSPELIPVT